MHDTARVPRRSILLLGAAAAGITVGGVQTYRLLGEPRAASIPLGPTRRVFSASAFGAVGDGVVDDGPPLRRALSAAGAAGPGAILRLSKGRYRVMGEPEAGYALPISGARGLTVAGDDATVVVGDPTLGCFSLTDCESCQVVGLAIDYEPLPFTQTIVSALDPAGQTFNVDVVAGYPRLDAPFFPFAQKDEVHPATFGAVFDPATHLLKVGIADNVFISAAEPLGGSAFRLRALDPLPAGLSPGDVFVYLARQNGHALASYRSPRTGFRGVHVRAANAVAFALVQSDAVRIEACSVGASLGSGRLVSSNADAVHAQGCRVGPAIHGCTFAGMMDDGLNVYALPMTIQSVTSDAEIVVAGSVSVRTGDRLEFSDSVSGRITGVVRVAGVTPTQSGTNLSVSLDSAVPGLSISARDGVADTAFNLSASGEGYVVRGNRYERHRGHAMRLHTGRGVVEGNHISQTSREGISVSNDPDWPEGPHARDLLIRGNTLMRTGGDAAIHVEGRKLGYHLADSATQQTLRIEGNTVRNWHGSAIAVGAAKNVQLHENRIAIDTAAEASVAKQGILLERVYDVEINGLVLSTPSPARMVAAIVIAPTVPAGGAGVRISGVRASNGVRPVQDLRVAGRVGLSR